MKNIFNRVKDHFRSLSSDAGQNAKDGKVKSEQPFISRKAWKDAWEKGIDTAVVRREIIKTINENLRRKDHRNDP